MAISIDDPRVMAFAVPWAGSEGGGAYGVVVRAGVYWSLWIDVESALAPSDFKLSVAYYDAVQECLRDLVARYPELK